ncbi:hypothetical protein GQ42DRAFT_162050, partial [Ramicandelaber brevisporus]
MPRNVKYDLLYWKDINGRGEVIKAIFALANVEYTYTDVQLADWMVVKATTPLGHIPVLRIIDADTGETVDQLAESGAIERWLAKRFGVLNLPALGSDATHNSATWTRSWRSWRRSAPTLSSHQTGSGNTTTRSTAATSPTAPETTWPAHSRAWSRTTSGSWRQTAETALATATTSAPRSPRWIWRSSTWSSMLATSATPMHLSRTARRSSTRSSTRSQPRPSCATTMPISMLVL